MTELKIAAESATGLTMEQTYRTSFEAAMPRIWQQPTLDFMGHWKLSIPCTLPANDLHLEHSRSNFS